MTHKKQRAEKQTNAAFTMIEVLIAMGIFAIGFSMVAAIFPIAILLQQQTSNDVMSKQIALNAEALLKGRSLAQTDLADTTYGQPAYLSTLLNPTNYDIDTRVHAMPPSMLVNMQVTPATAIAPSIWTANDRSYPSTAAMADRIFFWVPLILDSDPTNASYLWTAYIFVLKKQSGAVYTKDSSWANPNDNSTIPGVAMVPILKSTIDQSRINFQTTTFNQDTNSDGKPDQIDVGDMVLDNNGVIYTVTDATTSYIRIEGIISSNPNTLSQLWYAPPGTAGKSSPLLDIIAVPNETSSPIVK